MSAPAPDVVKAFADLSGLELMEMARDGGFRVGIGDTLGMDMEEAEEGRVVFSLATGPHLANPNATLHGGVAATLLDSAITCAVHTTLPAGSRATTLDLAVRYLRPGKLDGSRVRAEGRIVHAGRSTAVAEGELRDEEGRLLATASSTCMIRRA